MKGASRKATRPLFICDTNVLTSDGILFDFDKATIRPESKPTLDAVAKLLRGQADLSLFVVGHADAVGGFQHKT